MTGNRRQPGAPRPLRLVPATGRSADDEAPLDEGAHTVRIEVSPDVVRVLGAATVMRLRADDGLREYVCPFCDQPPGGRTSLVVTEYVNGLSVVRLAHATCSPSNVLRILAAPTRLRHRVRATCWLARTSAGSSSAILLVDNQVRAWPRHRAREAAERYDRALEATGFVQVTSLDHLPSPTTRLTAALVPISNAAARIQVSHQDALVFDGDVTVPDPWLRHAEQHRTFTVMSGTGLAPTALSRRANTQDAQRFLDAVTRAVSAGRAWTAVAALSPTGSTRPVLEERHTPRNPPGKQAG
ncbi:MAG TPA: hypothetical protein VI248_29940 [Kineosporiaceae bacterium]